MNLKWIGYCENNTKGVQLYIIMNYFVAELDFTINNLGREKYVVIKTQKKLK